MRNRGAKKTVFEYEEIEKGNGSCETSNIRKVLCEPTRRHGIFFPSPKHQLKAKCFLQDYYKGYGSNTHERQYVMYVKPNERRGTK